MYLHSTIAARNGLPGIVVVQGGDCGDRERSRSRWAVRAPALPAELVDEPLGQLRPVELQQVEPVERAIGLSCIVRGPTLGPQVLLLLVRGERRVRDATVADAP